MTRILAAGVAVLIASRPAVDALTPSAVLLAAAVLAVVGLTAVTARHLAVSCAVEAPEGPGTPHAERTIFVRLRDPDAAGRPRPRAPTVPYGAA